MKKSEKIMLIIGIILIILSIILLIDIHKTKKIILENEKTISILESMIENYNE